MTRHLYQIGSNLTGLVALGMYAPANGCEDILESMRRYRAKGFEWFERHDKHRIYSDRLVYDEIPHFVSIYFEGTPDNPEQLCAGVLGFSAFSRSPDIATTTRALHVHLSELLSDCEIREIESTEAQIPVILLEKWNRVSFAQAALQSQIADANRAMQHQCQQRAR